jgi:hypothetical protein
MHAQRLSALAVASAKASTSYKVDRARPGVQRCQGGGAYTTSAVDSQAKAIPSALSVVARGRRRSDDHGAKGTLLYGSAATRASRDRLTQQWTPHHCTAPS